jgi:Mce-associated membrane protein
VTTLGRGKRQAETQAEKAEKARERAAEAAKKAEKAEAEAAAALREAEEAEAEAAEDAETTGETDETDTEADEKAEPEAKVDLKKAAPKDEDPDEDEADEPADRTRRWIPPFGTRSAALLVVNLVLIGLLGWLFVTVQGLKSDEKAVNQVTFAAKQAAEDLSSYDFRTIDADLKRATGQTTGSFRADFTKMTASVKPSATQQQAVVQGTAVRTSVESVDGRKAIALVYLDQATAKGANGERTPNQYTLRLVMTKVGDRWLVSQLQMI